MSLVIVNSKNGVRVHRDTCKRIPANAEPAEPDLSKVSLYYKATAASCCKPDKQLAELRQMSLHLLSPNHVDEPEHVEEDEPLIEIILDEDSGERFLDGRGLVAAAGESDEEAWERWMAEGDTPEDEIDLSELLVISAAAIEAAVTGIRRYTPKQSWHPFVEIPVGVTPTIENCTPPCTHKHRSPVAAGSCERDRKVIARKAVKAFS